MYIAYCVCLLLCVCRWSREKKEHHAMVSKVVASPTLKLAATSRIIFLLLSPLRQGRMTDVLSSLISSPSSVTFVRDLSIKQTEMAMQKQNCC
jgi:hypothetical protein